MRVILLTVLISGVSFGTVAPNFQADTLAGKKISLGESLKPGRALLVSFWASWCTPCIEELTHVTEHLKAEPNLPLDVISVNVDTSETATDIKPSVRMHKIPFTVALDPKQEILAKYNTSKTLPFSVLVGSTGNIEATFNGFHEGMFAKVKEIVTKTTK